MHYKLPYGSEVMHGHQLDIVVYYYNILNVHDTYSMFMIHMKKTSTWSRFMLASVLRLATLFRLFVLGRAGVSGLMFNFSERALLKLTFTALLRLVL